MFKLDLNKHFKGLDGVEVKATKFVGGREVPDPAVGHMGRLVASQLAGGTKGELLKVMPWAQALYDGKPITLDLADKIFLEGYIAADQALTNLVKYQLAAEFAALKDEELPQPKKS